jgi:hypothetical protein
MSLLDFTRGDFVIIKYVENSPLNIFKGYFGEIKSYIKHNEFAMIILEATNQLNEIKFPNNHFVKRKFIEFPTS